MKESIEDLRDTYETYLKSSYQTPKDVTYTTWLQDRVSLLEDKLFQKEIIIRRYESEKHELVKALNNILGESFK